MLTVVPLLLALSQPMGDLNLPAPEADVVVTAAAQGDVQQAQAKGTAEEIGFMDRFLPFSLGTVDKRVDDAWVLTLVGNLCLPFGGLWMPLVVLKDRPEMSTDVIISYVVPYLIEIGAMLVCGIGIITIPIIYIVGGLVTTNATLKAWDRAYKGSPIGGDAKPAPKKSARRESRPRVAMAY